MFKVFGWRLMERTVLATDPKQNVLTRSRRHVAPRRLGGMFQNEAGRFFMARATAKTCIMLDVIARYDVVARKREKKMFLFAKFSASDAE